MAKIYYKQNPGQVGEVIEMEWEKGCSIVSKLVTLEMFEWFLEGDLLITPLGAFCVSKELIK